MKNGGFSTAIFHFCSSQWKGSNTASFDTQLSFLLEYIIKGAPTTTTHPIANTEYHTALLPVAIWAGGMKLRIKASNEPQNPTPLTSHIIQFPFLPIL